MVFWSTYHSTLQPSKGRTKEAQQSSARVKIDSHSHTFLFAVISGDCLSRLGHYYPCTCFFASSDSYSTFTPVRASSTASDVFTFALPISISAAWRFP